MAMQTGLDYMRLRTHIDCDTMDDEGKRIDHSRSKRLRSFSDI